MHRPLDLNVELSGVNCIIGIRLLNIVSQDLQDIVDAVRETSRKTGLKINVEKTSIMALSKAIQRWI